MISRTYEIALISRTFEVLRRTNEIISRTCEIVLINRKNEIISRTHVILSLRYRRACRWKELEETSSQAGIKFLISID